MKNIVILISGGGSNMQAIAQAALRRGSVDRAESEVAKCTAVNAHAVRGLAAACRAVDAVLAQRYEGPVEVVVVFDGAAPDLTLIHHGPDRRVRVVVNSRTPGLAGARNTGAL